MKKTYFIGVLLVGATLLTSCTSYRIIPVGDFTTVSTRNIETEKDYINLRSYAGIARTDIEASVSSAKKGIIKKRNPIIKEVNSFKSVSLQDAVDNVVRSVPGGEYLHNVRFYRVEQTNIKFKSKTGDVSFVATGDVWGIKGENHNIKGFKVDDEVVFTYDKDVRKLLRRNFRGQLNKQYRGKLIGLKGGLGTVQLENGTVVDLPYSSLTNLNQ